VAAACSRKFRIGIDIEKPGRNIEKIAPRFLSAKEWGKWQSSSNLLTLAWSAKESVYKAVGIPGLSFQKEMNKRIINMMTERIVNHYVTPTNKF
jgi:4'-phosphopantetheinyl transferase EntD